MSTKQTSQYLIEQIVLQNQKIPGLNAQKTESQLMVAAIDDIDLLPLSVRVNDTVYCKSILSR